MSTQSQGLKNSKLFIIGLFSNIIEWYDFTIFAFLAVTMGELFFDSTSATQNTLKALLLFSVSYLMRPLGSLYFGYISDRMGTAKALRLSLFWMAFPTAIIAFLPNSNTLGLATVLLIILRLIQGFATGGELPISACFLFESKKISKYRTFFCSLATCSSILGVMLGSVVAFLLHIFFTPSAILAWAWRIPFFLGIPIFLIVLVIRSYIPKQTNIPKKINWQIVFISPKNLSVIVLLNLFISVAFYTFFVWLPVYLSSILNFSETFSFGLNSIGLLVIAMSTLFFAWACSSVDKKILGFIATMLILLLIYPLYLAIDRELNIQRLIEFQLVFAILLGALESMNMELMACLFQDHVRGLGLSFIYTATTAIFGGLAPALANYMSANLEIKSAPFLILGAASLLGLLGFSLLSKASYLQLK